MRMHSLAFLSVMLVPAISCADDMFINNNYKPPVQQEEQPQDQGVQLQQPGYMAIQNTQKGLQEYEQQQIEEKREEMQRQQVQAQQQGIIQNQNIERSVNQQIGVIKDHVEQGGYSSAVVQRKIGPNAGLEGITYPHSQNSYPPPEYQGGPMLNPADFAGYAKEKQ